MKMPPEVLRLSGDSFCDFGCDFCDYAATMKPYRSHLFGAWRGFHKKREKNGWKSCEKSGASFGAGASPWEPQKARHWAEKPGRMQHGGHLESGANGRYSRLDVGLYSGICP